MVDVKHIVWGCLQYSVLEKMPSLLQASIAKFMDTSKVGENSPIANKGSGGLLGMKYGKLMKSFSPKNANNIYDVDYKNEVISVRYGSRMEYARIQDQGGSIPATTRMQKYFMARYINEHNKYWLGLAIHAKRAGTMTMPAHPYMDNAMEYFRVNYLPQLITDFINNAISKIFVNN